MSARRLEPRHYLVLFAVLTVILWQFPLGQTLLYPFTLLATYAHEMGHGTAALLMGASFDSLRMFPDGSGVAQWHGDVGRLARGFIAAGGLVGPSVAGATVLMLTRRARVAPFLLYALGGLMALSAVVVAQGPFTLGFVLAVAVTLFAVAWKAPRTGAVMTAQLVGVQLCLAVFRDVSYMFTEGGMVGGTLQRSDSAAIADALFLPYWFWGALTAVFSFAVLALGLWVALRGHRRPAP